MPKRPDEGRKKNHGACQAEQKAHRIDFHDGRNGHLIDGKQASHHIRVEQNGRGQNGYREHIDKNSESPSH